MNHRGSYKTKQDPFFVFSDGSHVCPNQLRTVLCATIKSLNLDQSLYDGHSVRIGRTSDLYKLGYSIDHIRMLGHWKSNAVYKFIIQIIQFHFRYYP